MKIFDCTTYFDEPMMYNLRLNILDKHIDEFVVCEALYTHKGEKKKKLILIKTYILNLRIELHI